MSQGLLDAIVEALLAAGASDDAVAAAVGAYGAWERAPRLRAPIHSDVEIETAITALGREAGGGLVISGGIANVHRAPIISAAARHNVPAVYYSSDFARDGGLLSYGPDPVDIIRRAASYVDRILRGAKPGDLPVQFPTKYEMIVNLKTAKALGLTVPQSILLRADEVIE